MNLVHNTYRCSLISLLLFNDMDFQDTSIEKVPETINTISENLCKHLVLLSFIRSGVLTTAKRDIYEINGKAMTDFLRESKKQLLLVHRKNRSAVN
jgi:hypothetical protein